MLTREVFGVVGTSFGLIEADVHEVANALADWWGGIWAKNDQKGIVETYANVPILGAIPRLFPLTLPVPKRRLVHQSHARWTSYFDNGVHGTDAQGPMQVLAERVGTRSLAASLVPNTIDAAGRGCYGARLFAMFDRHGNEVRTINCANDGGTWMFHLGGTALAEEGDTSTYAARRISHRFPEIALRQLLKGVAFDAFDADCYDAGDAVMLTSEGHFAGKQLEVGESEARKRQC